MTDERPTRRDILKPVQLLGFAFAAALFAGFIALMSMGFFQSLTGPEREHVVVVSLVIAGIAFISTLLSLSRLLLLSKVCHPQRGEGPAVAPL